MHRLNGWLRVLFKRVGNATLTKRRVFENFFDLSLLINRMSGRKERVLRKLFRSVIKHLR